LRALPRVARNVLRPLAEIPQNRVRLPERATVVEDKRRDSQRRIQATEQLLATRPVDDVDFLPLERRTQVCQQEAHLVAVARNGGVVQLHGDPFLPGIQSVPASGTRAIAAASTVSATRSSGSRLWRCDLPQARASVCASSVSTRR